MPQIAISSKFGKDVVSYMLTNEQVNLNSVHEQQNASKTLTDFEKQAHVMTLLIPESYHFEWIQHGSLLHN